jgi:hypothetical protein
VRAIVPAARPTGALAFGLVLLLGCYPTRRPAFPEFEPSRPPPRVTGERSEPPPGERSEPPPGERSEPPPGERADPSTGRAPLPTWRDPCFEAPATRAYLEALRDRVLASWRPTPEHADRVARVRFSMVLRSTGEIESLALAHESPAGIGEQVRAAVEAAQPFGELPPEATCLAGKPLIIHFTLESFEGPSF